MKFVVFTETNSTSAHLEFYYDLTGGLNGGAWTLGASLVDTQGSWPAQRSFSSEDGCANTDGDVILGPRAHCFLRVDKVKDAHWTNASVRHILPDSKLETRYSCDLAPTAAPSVAPPPVDYGLPDAENNFAVGERTVLAMAVCPSDSPGCYTSSYPFGFCYGKVASDYECKGVGVFGYLAQVMQTASDYLESASWGQFTLATAFSPLLRLDYTGAACGDFDALATYSTRDPAAIDMMAFAAARALGSEPNQYDLNVIFMPRCDAQGFSGVGWVGAVGALLNLYAYDYDASVAHELGHNVRRAIMGGWQG